LPIVVKGICKVARREIVVLEDDLDGGKADETVKYALDGVQYEIDLTAKNAARLRESFSDFIAHGRRVGRGGVVVGGRAAARARGSAAADREQNKAIRAWAKRKGRNISDRGRIPQEIVDEYNADAGR
jgi:Lsr2